MHFSVFLKNFAAWTGILQRQKPNPEKGKRQEHTGFPSPWALMIFFLMGCLCGTLFDEYDLWIVTEVAPWRYDCDLPRVFKCLSLAAPLGQGWAQDSVSGHILETGASLTQRPPPKEQQLFCSLSGVLDLVCNSCVTTIFSGAPSLAKSFLPCQPEQPRTIQTGKLFKVLLLPQDLLWVIHHLQPKHMEHCRQQDSRVTISGWRKVPKDHLIEKCHSN